MTTNKPLKRPNFKITSIQDHDFSTLTNPNIKKVKTNNHPDLILNPKL